MIKIERNNIEHIALQYFEELKKYIKSSKAKLPFLSTDFLFSKGELRYDIILCKPEKFGKVKKEFCIKYESEIQEYNELESQIRMAITKDEKEKCKQEIEKTDYCEFRMYMKERYACFIKKYGSWLSEELKVDTCPYCNRQYTFTINSKKKTRPQFDHFLPKSKYPYLALSFYNLVPCCPVCNLIKKEDEVDYHPYIKGFNDEYQFSVNHFDYILGRSKEIKILLKKTSNQKSRNRNIETFALNELYAHHNDYAQEIIDKAHAYNDDYYNGIIEVFSAINKTPSEINRLIFGNYIENAALERRPLSKLTKDILEQCCVQIVCK